MRTVFRWTFKHTTTDMTPDAVHALALTEVARVEGEMDAILEAEGLTEGTVGARVAQLGERPDQLYPDTDANRAQILRGHLIGRPRSAQRSFSV